MREMYISSAPLMFRGFFFVFGASLLLAQGAPLELEDYKQDDCVRCALTTEMPIAK